MKEILFITTHRKDRSPGQRFRFEQYLDFLEQNDFRCTVSFIVSEKDDKILYQRRRYFQKFIILVKSILKRFKDVRKAKQYDIIFIFREALMFGSTYFEKRFKKSGAKIIYDFDDSIWLHNVSEVNNDLGWLKRPLKTSTIIKLSDCVFVGNNFLASYASQFTNNVKVIPTTINTNKSKKIDVHKPANKICIGWTGSFTTLKHLELAVPYLKIIKKKYGDRIYFKVISDIPFQCNEIAFEYCKWDINSEIEDLSYIDIGIMPLQDDEWSKGKCGFKGLQYMSLEIPTVMSAVGVNKEIIQDGINGFLANDTNEWVEKLSQLIESPTLRQTLGKNGRQTVIEKYSFDSQKMNYLRYINELIELP